MSLQQDINQELDKIAAALEQYPERRADLAAAAALRGELRRYATFALGRVADINAGEGLTFKAPPVRTPEERVLDQLRGTLRPLEMLNPISPRLGCGKGPGTLAASFGIFLDPTLGFAPGGSRPLAEVIAEGMPSPATSGMLPEIKADIQAGLSLTPDWIKINPPDMQGPFNIAHMVLGDQAFIAPYEEPEKFFVFMSLVTDFFIAVRHQVEQWIGPTRLNEFPPNSQRIAECSVNLVSTAFYEEFILPHDRRIEETFGQVSIHPCSGPHVFYETLRNLRHVTYTEAGYIEKACAGSISVEAALAEVGNRPIIIAVGQELPPGKEEQTIRRDFDLARTNPRLCIGGYTGMYWHKCDEPRMREMHRRLDDYWEREVWGKRPGI